MNQESETSRPDVNTGGGAYVDGNVTAGGDFGGRDIVKPVITIQNPENSSSGVSIIAIVALVIFGGIMAMFFYNSSTPNGVVAIDTPTIVPPPPQVTDILVAPTQTPSTTPAVELTATPEPEPTGFEFSCIVANEISALECEVLVALYADIGTPSQNGNPCEWPGVTCEGGHVSQIYITSNQLRTLPVEINQLSRLEVLYLYDNKLRTLPSEIWNLSSLESLDLSGNHLSILPAEVNNLSSLVELNLSGNQLDSLPPEIGDLSNLNLLNLSRQRLNSLPAEIGYLHNLETLYLHQNQLSTLPKSLQNLTNLRSLDLGQNRLNITDMALLEWMNKNDSDWADTQAVMLPTPTATNTQSASTSIIPGAVDQTEINFCVKDLAYDSLPALDSTLLILAKREAVEELLGGQTISETKTLDGSVRIFDAPRYYDGERDDEYCVSFVAYITVEDQAQ